MIILAAPFGKIVRQVNGGYTTDNVNVSYSGKYFYYTTKPYYLTLCMFPAEIKESSMMQELYIYIYDHFGGSIPKRLSA
jgi:hypothetical protein